MTRYHYIMFDMDGTLLDSAYGVTTAVSYALASYGIDEKPENLKNFVGLPIRDGFIEYYGFDPEKAQEALVRYREKFSVEGIHQNTVQPGIKALLARLLASGCELFVATCKPEPFARIILDRNNLIEYFVAIGGGEFNSGRQTKEQVLRYLLQRRSITDVTKVLVVGDRKYDVQAARALGAGFVGVTWGYGSEEELREAGAETIVRMPEELERLLRGDEMPRP